MHYRDRPRAHESTSEGTLSEAADAFDVTLAALERLAQRDGDLEATPTSYCKEVSRSPLLPNCVKQRAKRWRAEAEAELCTAVPLFRARAARRGPVGQ